MEKCCVNFLNQSSYFLFGKLIVIFTGVAKTTEIKHFQVFQADFNKKSKYRNLL